MNKTPVYCALIEIQLLDGCQLGPSETAGASVRCDIPPTNHNGYLDSVLGGWDSHPLIDQALPVQTCIFLLGEVGAGGAIGPSESLLPLCVK